MAMNRNEQRWLKERAARKKAGNEAFERRTTPLMRSFNSLEFELNGSAYWKLPSGYELVLMYEWKEREDGGIEWRNDYDVEIRGHGHIDLSECPLLYMYINGSFSDMSSNDVVRLAEWIEKYVADKERKEGNHELV